MQITIKIAGIPETLKALAQIEDLANGKSAALRPAFQNMGMEALRLISENMMKEGKLAGGWPKLSPVTLLLRRQGKGQKIKDMADLRAKPHKILQDTGLLFNSLHSRGDGNVFEVGNLQVTVGTADRKALLHQKGGVSTFKFDKADRARFDQNVAKVLPGAKPKTTPTGKKSRAKKNWNPFYFKWLAILNKMKGRNYKVPARPILWQLKSGEEQRILVILEDYVIKQASKIWEQV